jgi:hypothetical protein
MPPVPVSWNGLNSQGQPLTWGDPEFVWGANLPNPNPKPRKRMPQLRVLLGFTNAPDHQLEETAGAVIENLYGSAGFPTPPVTVVALQAALTAFTDSIAAQVQGGTAATADKNNKRDALIDLLRQLASYVQEQADNDLAKLLSSGFDAVSTNRAQAVLEPPVIKDILNGNSGQLLVRVGPVKNAKAYEVRYALAPAGQPQGPWQSGGLFTNSRSMPINSLTPGQNYMFQVRAIGGSTGYSDWSNPVGHMSM